LVSQLFQTSSFVAIVYVLYIVTYLKRYSERFFIGPALLLKGTEQKQLVKIETEVTYSLIHEFFSNKLSGS
jgi:hypothetical protein